jgi:hypothetical protein
MSKGTRRMLQALHTYAYDNSWCYPSVNQLATHADLDERQARRALRWLEAQHYIESQPRIGQTTIYRLISHQEQGEGGHLPPTIEIKRDLNPPSVKACERPPVIVSSCASSLGAEPIACEGGASYNPAEDWTLQTHVAPERKPWRASVLPKDFFTLYRATRECTAPGAFVRQVVEHRQADEQPDQTTLELEQADDTPRPSSEAQAQLGHIEAQIWRTPPTDPKKRRTYYVLKRKAEQVERSNPKQAHALRMQARNLEEVSELLIAATSCTTELEEATEDRRQGAVAPVSGRASSELPAARSLLPGIQFRPRLVNVTPTQARSTSVQAAAAPSMTGGGSHAQPTMKLEQIDELWISAKRREIARLEQQGQHERAQILCGMVFGSVGDM